MRFGWDPVKAAANLEEHGVSFAEASTVLSDDFALTREDPGALGEQRFVTLGLSDSGNLLVVVYTHRQPDLLRVISAWKANRRQSLKYEKSRR
ncbi:MAG TPA: BrnT family toxin [Thermoanaerobaculia bacterium]|nr:BrnT family toxin [Thermoanaerobaculia bacterium]